jgi:hypothetical protein
VEPGRTGWLVQRGDADALGRAILLHLEDPARARAMGRAGRERVYPHLSIDRLATDLDEIYRELLIQHSGVQALAVPVVRRSGVPALGHFGPSEDDHPDLLAAPERRNAERRNAASAASPEK